MPPNRAAFQPARKATSLRVSEASYPIASDDQIIIRNAAVAINPIDWIIQRKGDMAFPHIKYPFPLGFDTAGEIVFVGRNITDLRIGDRVVGFARGCEESVNSAAEGAFQDYVLLSPEYTSRIPESLPYEQAVVTPMSITTAGAALFDKGQLALQLPTCPYRQATGKTVIIWGGSTSVGCSAIQLAIAAGYEVVSTASPKNFDMVRSLGAVQVFDYRSPSVTEDMAAALKTKTVAGAVSIGHGAAELCMDILGACGGNTNKFVALVTYPLPEKDPEYLVVLRRVAYFASWMIQHKMKGMIRGIKFAIVLPSNDVSKYIFLDFLPQALKAGSFKPMPEPKVVGHGLESIQAAMDQQRTGGVSAQKLVVTL